MGEENSYINSFKKPRRYFICWKKADEPVDLISELHESLLVKIISLLYIVDAVKTSVLSKRWKNLWTQLDMDDIDLGCSAICLLQFEFFVSFVHNVLRRCTSNNLNNFSLYASCDDFNFDDDDDDDDNYDDFADQTIECWLERVFKKNVKRLTIQISGFSYRPLEWFYQNTSLIDLVIREWNIKIHDDESVSWTSLKSLTLSNVSITTEWLEKILAGCPVLEDLTLDRIVSITDLYIESPSVRRVKIVHGPASDYLLDIDAPWIEELEISGGFYGIFLQLLDVSSLVNVKLDFRHYNQSASWGFYEDLLLDVATTLLKNVCHVEELTLGPVFIQAISLLILSGNPSPLFPFVRCKRLTVQLPVTKYELPGLVCLLQNSPILETLIIEVENSSQCGFEKYLDEICHFDEDSYLSTQTGDFTHLKTVEVNLVKNACSHEYFRRTDIKCHDYELVAYLLSCAHSLKKLFVTSHEVRCVCSGYCQFQYASVLSQKIESNFEFSEEWRLRREHTTFEFSHCGSASEPTNSV